MGINDDTMDIETFISLIGSDYRSHLELRRYFTMKSRLIKEDIVILDRRSERTDMMDTV